MDHSMDSSRISEHLSRKLRANLSFAGCGFLGIYHVGVGVCFKKYASHLLLHKIAGASAGALVACCLLLDVPLDNIAKEFFEIVNEARTHKLGPFSPNFDIQKVLLNTVLKYLPPDAHKKVNGRLHISLTRIFDCQNVVVSQFNSREDLLEALACSFFIPVFSGVIPPKFHNVRYMDGAYSDNLISLDDNTVTVSPFAGESDICPKGNSEMNYLISLSNTSMELSTRNVHRLVHSLIPPPPNVLSELCQQGFNDALDFLYRNDLISCNDCSTIHFNYLTSNEPPEEYDPECECCADRRETSVKESMPDYVLNTLAMYVEGPNSAFTKWFKTLALPVTIPCSIATHFLKSVPIATRVAYEFRRSMSENFHERIINWLNSLSRMGRTPEEKQIERDERRNFNSTPHKSSKNVTKENFFDRKFVRRNGNFK